MKINKELIEKICNKVMEFSLYTLVFYLPISKAIIEICASIAILAFFIKKIITKKFLPDTLLNKYLFVYLLMCIISIIFSTNIQISLKTFFLKLLESVLFYFIVFEVVDSKRKMATIITIFSLSATLVCADGFFQYFTHKDFLRHRKWPFDLKPFTLRISGPFMTPNDFAAYLAPLGILNLGLVFVKFKSWFVRLFSKVLLISLLACLFLTLSRGAWVGAFIGLVFLGIFTNRRAFFKIVLIMLLVFLMLGMFLPQEKKDFMRFGFNFSDPGSRDRRALMKIGLEMWKSEPLVGVGLGTFMHNFDRFRHDKKSYPWGVSYAHNCYLQTLSETGLLGFLSFLFLIAAIFFKSIAKLKKLVPGFERVLGFSLLAALSAYLAHSAFDTNLYSLDIGMLYWLLLGLSQSQINLAQKYKLDN